MKLLPAVLASLAVAVLCAVSQCFADYYLDIHPVWSIWLIGTLVGLTAWCVSKGSGRYRLGMAAMLFTLLAFLSIHISLQYISVEQRQAQVETLSNDPEGHLWSIATEIAEEWQDAGRTLDWPNGANVSNALHESDFPVDVWSEANKRWNAMSPEEQREEKLFQQALRSALNTQVASAGGVQRLVLRDAIAHLPPLTFLFLVLGLFTAYRFGAGFERISLDSNLPDGTSSDASC